MHDPEGTEEGATCNRDVIDEASMDHCTTVKCEGKMELKVLDMGPVGQEAYLECSECLYHYPE